MDRSLAVEIDINSWPAGKIPPASFVTAAGSFNVNIPTLLLLIGFLTTPSHASGITLSEFWAWVRYLNAISEDGDLRISEDFYQLDAHQKTILSDDFGMGISVYWLFDKLGISTICDGKYFIERIAASVGATTIPNKKRGPSKSPDFVIKDTNDIWHILECKGTQSGQVYRNRQLGSLGALTQKNTIVFPPGYSGQQLGGGLCISRTGSNDISSLKIVDPPKEDPIMIDKDQMRFADDAIERSIGSRSLRLAGFGASASFMSAPMGKSPSSARTEGKAEETRQEFVDAKRFRASEEVRQQNIRDIFQSKGEKFRGRTVSIDLPVPIAVAGRTVTRVRVRNGINKRFLTELRGFQSAERSEVYNPGLLSAFTGSARVSHGKNGAALQLGELFVSDLKFE